MQNLAVGAHLDTATILKGWNQLAQGRDLPRRNAVKAEERATLGVLPQMPPTLKALQHSVYEFLVVLSRCALAVGPREAFSPYNLAWSMRRVLPTKTANAI